MDGQRIEWKAQREKPIEKSVSETQYLSFSRFYITFIIDV